MTEPSPPSPRPDDRPSGYRRVALGITLALATVAAVELTEARLAWTNTLRRNGRWESTKVTLEMAVVGAVAFFVTPKALVHNRLDLAAWLGFEEVLFREPARLDRLAGAFRLGDGAYVTVLFGCDEARGFAGLRFSRDPHFPSEALVGEPDGRFTARRPLGPLPLRPDWNRFELRFVGGRTRVELNGRAVADLADLPVRAGRFGFRSGRRPVVVDDVEADGTDRGRAVRVREGFRNARGYPAALAASLAAVGLLGALVAALARGRNRWPALILTQLAACLLAAALQRIVEPYLARIHPKPGPALSQYAHAEGYDTRIESEPDVLARVRVEAAAPSPPGAVRLVFLGSSQTLGVGAMRRADAFVSRLARRLADGRPAGAAPVTTLNLAVTGDRAAPLVARYFHEFPALRPDAVVIDLGHNDQDAASVGRELDALATFNAAHGVRTALVLEANTLEGSPSDEFPDSWFSLTQNHRAMREVAARHGLAVFDLHRAIRARPDEGFMWWDKVHLTSFGNALAADLLYPTVEREVLAVEAARR